MFLMPPLTDDEKGPFAQHWLQEWYRTAEIPIDDRTPSTSSPTPVPPRRTASWRSTTSCGVPTPSSRSTGASLDHASRVPEGAVPVADAHPRVVPRAGDQRATCANNIDFDRWFRQAAGPEVLQTFHGYPAKSMGIRMWEAKHFTPAPDRSLELARTSRDWDLILTPAPEMDVHYRARVPLRRRRSTAPATPATTCCCPPDAERIRQETRDRLGIADGPDGGALRADLARRPGDDYRVGRAGAPPRPRVRQRTRSGPDYVLLMRGHRFHAQGARPQRAHRAADRRHRLPRDQRPDPGVGRRGARLLLAAVRLRADRPADGLPGAGPGVVHRRRPRLPLRLRGHRARAAAGRPPTRSIARAAGPRRRCAGVRGPRCRVQRRSTTTCRTAGPAERVVRALLRSVRASPARPAVRSSDLVRTVAVLVHGQVAARARQVDGQRVGLAQVDHVAGAVGEQRVERGPRDRLGLQQRARPAPRRTPWCASGCRCARG